MAAAASFCPKGWLTLAQAMGEDRQSGETKFEMGSLDTDSLMLLSRIEPMPEEILSGCADRACCESLPDERRAGRLPPSRASCCWRSGGEP